MIHGTCSTVGDIFFIVLVTVAAAIPLLIVISWIVKEVALRNAFKDVIAYNPPPKKPNDKL